MISWVKTKEAKQLDAFADNLVQIVQLFQSNGGLSGTPLPGIADNTYRLLTEAAVYISCILTLGALAFSKEPDPSLQAYKLTIKWLNRFIGSYTLIDPETGKESFEDSIQLVRRVSAVYREYSDVLVPAMDLGEDTENRQMLVTELVLHFYANVIDDQDKARKPFADVMLFGAPFFALSIDAFNGVKKIVGHQMITEQRLAEIEARHTTNPIWQWFNRASQAYWGFAGRVAGYFPKALGTVRSTNPFVGIARLTFVFVAGFIIVSPLYLVLGPFVQIVLVIIAVIWTCLAGVFGWHRPSAAQLAESIAREQRAAQKPKSNDQSFPA